VDIQIGLLGPMTARIGDVSILPTAGKPRQALALLALQANQVVSVPALMEEIWGADLPRSAPTTLQTYILQLRRKLNEAAQCRPSGAAKSILATVHGGYRLALPSGCVDAHCFIELLGRGQEALRGADDPEASRLLGAALALWRGPMLVDVNHGRMLEIETLRLEETRLGALELRISAELRLGRHMDVLGELTALTAKHTMHENLHAQLMIALYRAGRPGGALEVFRQLRATLIDELGLEPCPSLQRLHQAVLNSDPALERRRRPDTDDLDLLSL
jgi:DNA-binding SARP family transcriptional activator